MLVPLNSDQSMHFEILRALSLARYYGADVSEVLQAAAEITPRDTESFSTVFAKLANRVHAQAEQIPAKYSVSRRDFYFRAATYFRCADFYLHGNPKDPRIEEYLTRSLECFDKALALIEYPNERLTLQGDGFTIPAIMYRPDNDRSKSRPTIIVGSGFDGTQEELLHGYGFPILERGYNLITYEGPGQPTVLREQDIGFITEWEKAVTPVVDYALTQSDVDASKLALVGVSMGGFLAVRAAAFEHRFTAVFAIDGVYDVHEAFTNVLPPQLSEMYHAGESEKLDKIMWDQIASPDTPTSVKWGVQQGMWAFKCPSPTAFLRKTKSMTLEGIAENVKCPVFVGDATIDEFFKGQPEKVKEALGDKAKQVVFSMDDAAGHHCQAGAAVLLNQQMWDWFDEVTSSA